MWPGARRAYRDDHCCRPASCGFPVAPSDAPSGIGQFGIGIGGIGTAPVWGYSQQITGYTGPAPVLVSHDPTVGAFIRASLPDGTIGGLHQVSYIPAFYGDSRIGRRPGGLAIGRGAVGHLRPYHGRLVLTVAGEAIDDFVIGESDIGSGVPVLVEQP